MVDVVLWGSFVSLILIFLILDLAIFHRKPHEIKFKEAVFWTSFWIALALGFNCLIYFMRGPELALEFLSGYLLEKALSIDNIFVFVLVFSFLKVPKQYQHKVLIYGLMGALVMRMGCILVGATILAAFGWTSYLFGSILILAAGFVFLQEREGDDLSKSFTFRLARKFLPVSSDYNGKRFYVKKGNRYLATPLLLAVVLIELFDLFYSIESIPAIFSVTHDLFIVYTSNIFALLGLKSLYFVMAHFMYRFHYMRYGLALILVFAGAKMIVEPFFPLSDWTVIAVIILGFGGSIVLSRAFPKKG